MPWRPDRDGVVRRTRPRGPRGRDLERGAWARALLRTASMTSRPARLLLSLLVAVVPACAPVAAPPSAEPRPVPVSSVLTPETPDAGGGDASIDVPLALPSAAAEGDERPHVAPVIAPDLDTATLAAPTLALARESEEDPARLLALGLPALSADGRRVLSLFEQEEGPVELEIADAATGRVIRRSPYPQQWEPTADGDVAPRIDAGARRRTDRMIAREGFRTLAAVPLVALDDDDDARPTLFAAGDVRVRASTSIDDVDGSLLEISIEVGDARLALRETGADHLERVTIAPDRSFVVLDESFCACECAWWSRVVPIPAAPSR